MHEGADYQQGSDHQLLMSKCASDFQQGGDYHQGGGFQQSGASLPVFMAVCDSQRCMSKCTGDHQQCMSKCDGHFQKYVRQGGGHKQGGIFQLHVSELTKVTPDVDLHKDFVNDSDFGTPVLLEDGRLHDHIEISAAMDSTRLCASS